MHRFLFLLLVSPLGLAMYASQTLEQQVKSAEIVVHVQIVAGQAHQYSYEVNGPDGPKDKRMVYKTCRYSYSARVVEAFKSDLPINKEIKFTSIEIFNLGSHQLVFLSDNKWALRTDVTSRTTSSVINQKEDDCNQGLPMLYSHHLSTGEFSEGNMWVSINGLEDLPESVFVSPDISIQPRFDVDGVWNSVPSIFKRYGKYARWQEFRPYLLKVIGELE